MNSTGHPSEILLIQVEQVWQLDKIMHDLGEAGVRARIQRRPKEYTSIITGVGSESYKIYVDADDFQAAKSVIAHLESEPRDHRLHAVSDGSNNSSNSNNSDNKDKIQDSGEPNYYKRVIVHTIFGLCLLPVVFNWTATLNYLKLRKQADVSSVKKWVALLILVTGWVLVGLIIAGFIGAIEL